MGVGFFICEKGKLYYNKTMNEVKLTDNEIKEGAPFAALSYVFFLWILAFIFKKDNRFAHFHAKQGIVIFIGEIVCGFLALFPLIRVLFYLIGLIMRKIIF